MPMVNTHPPSSLLVSAAEIGVCPWTSYLLCKPRFSHLKKRWRATPLLGLVVSATEHLGYFHCSPADSLNVPQAITSFTEAGTPLTLAFSASGVFGPEQRGRAGTQERGAHTGIQEPEVMVVSALKGLELCAESSFQ